MVAICAPDNAVTLRKAVPESKVIGEVIKQVGTSRVVIDGVGYHKDKVD